MKIYTFNFESSSYLYEECIHDLELLSQVGGLNSVYITYIVLPTYARKSSNTILVKDIILLQL